MIRSHQKYTRRTKARKIKKDGAAAATATKKNGNADEEQEEEPDPPNTQCALTSHETQMQSCMEFNRPIHPKANLCKWLPSSISTGSSNQV
jgi:hypothetical protein